jgi:hypothetical protein
VKSWRGRRGRPRQDRPETDLGTPEQQARRAVLAASGDPALSEYPLGLMLARRLIGREHHEAGCRYGFLYGRVIGKGELSCAGIYDRLAADVRPDRPMASEESEARDQALFRLGKNQLLAAGRRVCDATENIIVFGRLARFLDVHGRRGAAARRGDAAELAAVLAGLDALVACYGSGAARRGRMETHKAPSMVDRSARGGPPDERPANDGRGDFSVAMNRKICQAS